MAAYELQKASKQQDTSASDRPNQEDTRDPPKQDPTAVNCMHFANATDGFGNEDDINTYNEKPYYRQMCCTRGVLSSSTGSISYDNILSQANGKIDKDWLLLDNQLTIYVMVA